MKKLYLFATTVALSITLTFPSFAGSWKRTYVYDNNTTPISAWASIDGNWYYFDKDGYIVCDSWIGDYYLGSDGVMLKNTTTPDGYTVDKDGKKISVSKSSNNASHTNVKTNSQSVIPSSTEQVSSTYILNKKSKKFHLPSCSSVKQMKEKNKISFHGDFQEVLDKGYSPCSKCLK